MALSLAKRGFKSGDVIGLIGDNKPSWLFFELAAQAIGGMSLGIYRDTLDEEVGYLIDAAKVNFVYAEDQEQVDKILTIKRPKNNKTARMTERCIVFDSDCKILTIINYSTKSSFMLFFSFCHLSNF